MVEIQAAERREPPGVIPELPTELPGPGIGSADVGVSSPRGCKKGAKTQRLRPPLDTHAKMSIGVRHFCRSHLF